MLTYQRLQPIDLWPAESAAFLKADRPQPELRPSRLALNVNVRWRRRSDRVRRGEP
jgi:hypothetical protein